MPAFRIFASVLLLLSLAAAQEVKIAPKTESGRQIRERAISTSGQFVVYGQDANLRTQFAKNCEQIRRDVAAVLKLPPQWHYPAVVELHAKAPERSKRRTAIRVFPIEPQGYRFQLDVLYGEDFDSADLRSALVQLLVLEQMFHPPERKIVHDAIPAWILAGIEELVVYQRSEVPAEVYASLIESHQIPPVEEILTAEPETFDNSVTRRIYRASSAALVQALLDQGNGPVRFRVFLQDLAVEDATPIELLERHFETMRLSPASMEKWWALQMAAMSQRSAFTFLSIQESEQQLELALQVRFDNLPEQRQITTGAFASRITNLRNRRRRSDGENAFARGTIRDFEQFAGHPRLGEALKVTGERLGRIQNSVFPLYVGVVAEYGQVLALLLEGKTRDLAERLEKIDRTRAEIRALMTQVTDHMNWYDATQVEEESDAFDGYERALKNAEKLDRRKRNDPISRYLDAMEREFGD